MVYLNISKEYDPATNLYHVSMHQRSYALNRYVDDAFEDERNADAVFRVLCKVLNHEKIKKAIERIEDNYDTLHRKMIEEDNDEG